MSGTTVDWAGRLRASGLRATVQRVVTLDTLDQLGHATPEQLYEACSNKVSGLNLSTIYRGLEVLAAYGLVSHTHLSEASASYQLVDHATHAHLVCRGCDAVTELAPEIAESFAAAVADSQGFAVDYGHLSVFGRCAQCAAADGPDD